MVFSRRRSLDYETLGLQIIQKLLYWIYQKKGDQKMELFVISRTEQKSFTVYIVKGAAHVYLEGPGGRDRMLCDIKIKTIRGVGVIKTQEEWEKFYETYSIKNMKDFLTLDKFEELEGFIFNQESYDALMNGVNAKQLWIHYYKSNLSDCPESDSEITDEQVDGDRFGQCPTCLEIVGHLLECPKCQTKIIR